MKCNQELVRRQGCMGADYFRKKYYTSLYKSVYSRAKIYYETKFSVKHLSARDFEMN